IHGSHGRAWLYGQYTEWQVWPIVQTEDSLDRPFLKQAFFNHTLAAAFGFLRRLEDEAKTAVEILFAREIVGSSQQHRHMSVMAAGMADALVSRAVGKFRIFLDGQGIHVGAQADHGSFRAAVECRDN